MSAGGPSYPLPAHVGPPPSPRESLFPPTPAESCGVIETARSTLLGSPPAHRGKKSVERHHRRQVGRPQRRRPRTRRSPGRRRVVGDAAAGVQGLAGWLEHHQGTGRMHKAEICRRPLTADRPARLAPVTPPPPPTGPGARHGRRRRTPGRDRAEVPRPSAATRGAGRYHRKRRRRQRKRGRRRCRRRQGRCRDRQGCTVPGGRGSAGHHGQLGSGRGAGAAAGGTRPGGAACARGQETSQQTADRQAEGQKRNAPPAAAITKAAPASRTTAAPPAAEGRNGRDGRDEDDEGSGGSRAAGATATGTGGAAANAAATANRRSATTTCSCRWPGSWTYYDNYAFIRTNGYLAGPKDVYVSWRRCASTGCAGRRGHRRGTGHPGRARPRRDKYDPLVRLDTIDGMDPEEARRRPEFYKLTPLYPQERSCAWRPSRTSSPPG